MMKRRVIRARVPVVKLVGMKVTLVVCSVFAAVSHERDWRGTGDHSKTSRRQEGHAGLPHRPGQTQEW